MPTLKDLRTAAGLSQSELARVSGVSLETIKKIETGRVERPHPSTLRQLAAVLGQVPAVLHGSRNGHVFDPDTPTNTRRGGMPCMQLTGDLRGFVPLRLTQLTGTIDGPLASLTLRQHFSYSRTECDKVLEGVYRFPLPGDAAVTNVTVHFGDVLIQTRLAPRADAEAQYATARQQGKQAALTTRESSDVLTLHLTGLQPDQPVVVETTFVQLAETLEAGWELRVPLTIGSRYSRPDEAGSSAARGQPLAVWCDPGHRFSLDLSVRDALGVASPTHPLATRSEPDWSERVQLAVDDGSIVPDRDFVLRWRTAQSEQRPSLQVMQHEDLSEQMRYFLALVTPPATEAGSTIQREITLLVDRSGSMQGAKWQACCWAVRRFLNGLSPTDTFRLGLFESGCEWLSPAPLLATADQRAHALEFLDARQPSGGTELGPALEQALRAPRTPGNPTRHVLLITDGQVSDDGRILQLVEAEAERQDRRRLSILCIDAAPRSAFVRDLVEAGGGIAVFLTSDPAHDDITSALDRVLDTWSCPITRDARLVVDAASNAGHTRSVIDLGDLPAKQSLWVSGAVPLFSEPVLRLGADEVELASASLDGATPVEDVDRPAIRALFGAHQLLRLERLQVGHYDDAARNALLDALGYAHDPLRIPELPPLYTENTAKLQTPIIQKLLERESLRFGLVCSATAFVGERSEAGRRIEASVIVPSALPAGWSSAFADAPLLKYAAAAAPMMAEMAADSAAMVDAPPTARMRSSRPALRFALRYQGTPALPADSDSLTLAQEQAPGPVILGTMRVHGDSLDVDESVELWLCIDTPHTPAVRMKVRELLELGAPRPLNVAVQRGETVLLRLYAPTPLPGSLPTLRVEVLSASL